MSTADGHVIGTTKVVDHGDPALRWNLVILGDGYQAGQIAQFAANVSSFIAKLQSEPPFGDVWTGINVYRIDVASTDSGADDPVACGGTGLAARTYFDATFCGDGVNQRLCNVNATTAFGYFATWRTDSGADDPAACGGTGATARTYFDASFCNNGIQRLLLVNNTTVHGVVNAEMPQAHMIMVLVNSPIYGGSGGEIAVVSLAPSADEIALHEMGHTAFGFADEYESYAGCGVDPPGTRDRYTGPEPGQPNITASPDRATIKWASLVAAATPMPTTTNEDCGQCDPQPNPFPAATVGAYEGAGYFHCALYRPQFDCRMRALGNPFCAVCQGVIRQALAPHLPAPVYAATA